MSLKNEDLYGKYEQLIKLKRETYDKLYKRCVNQIKMASKMGDLVCVFIIPGFLFGSCYPIIDIPSCANYMMDKLTNENNNIKTSFIEPNIIFIDWRKNE